VVVARNAAQRSASWISQSSSGVQSDLADLQARRAWSAGEEHSVASRRIMACRFVFVAAGCSWARHQLGVRDDTMPAAGPRRGDRPGLAGWHSTTRGKAMQPGFVFSSLLRPTSLEGGGRAGWWTARGSGPSRPAAGPPSGPGVGAVRLWVGMVVAAAAWMPWAASSAWVPWVWQGLCRPLTRLGGRSEIQRCFPGPSAWAERRPCRV
jgi:hypothetical protein